MKRVTWIVASVAWMLFVEGIRAQDPVLADSNSGHHAYRRQRLIQPNSVVGGTETHCQGIVRLRHFVEARHVRSLIQIVELISV